MSSFKEEYEDPMRAIVVKWITLDAPIERIHELLAEIREPANQVKLKRARIRTKIMRFVSPVEGAEIRNQLQGFTVDTREYEDKRNEIAREHGLTSRQVASAARKKSVFSAQVDAYPRA